MPIEWIQVRLSKATHRDLVAYRESIDRSRLKGHSKLQDLPDTVSLDLVIMRLLAKTKRHNQRKHESARRVAARKRAAAQAEGVDRG